MRTCSGKCSMIYGIHTDYLVAVEVVEHECHEPAWTLLQTLLPNDDELALAPQLLAGFIHIVTDPRRLPKPLEMHVALARAEHWWQAEEVVRVLPTHESTLEFLGWMRAYRLGRKRLLDTALAAAYAHAGIRRIITNDGVGFRTFGCFELIPFGRPNPV